MQCIRLAREGTKKGPTSVEPLRPREVVSDFYAIGDSSLRMIRLSSGPRDHTRQATASARAPRKSTISGRLRSVQVSLFLVAARGGAEGTRTPDIRLAKAALSQLSYGPEPKRTARWANLDSNQGPQSYQDCALAD